MESLPRSLSKRTYNANGFPAKTVYDDVFGGPPKFGVSTLSPRVEDYKEIFGGFHASRASSIPILDLPAVDGAGVPFDVRSSEFDYSEVFGGYDGLDFPVSCEELFSESGDGYESSDEAWSPAQSESLTDESDPSAFSEGNPSFSNGDSRPSFDGTKKFNISYYKAHHKSKEDLSNEILNMAHLNAVPGYTVMVNESPSSQTTKNRNPPSEATYDLNNIGMDYGVGVIEGKKLRKTMSEPANSVSGSPRKETFVTISDISLKTRPSHLAPPSRPPPALSVRKAVSDGRNVKLKASKSYAFERVAGDGSPTFFDVEVDTYSSSAASASAMKDEMQKTQAELRSNGVKPSAWEEIEKTKKTTRAVSGSIEGEEPIHLEEKASRRKHGNVHSSSQGSHKTEGINAWREAVEFYEVVEIEGSGEASEQLKDGNSWLRTMKFSERGQEEKASSGALEHRKFDRKLKTAGKIHECEENGNQPEVVKEDVELNENKGRPTEIHKKQYQEEYPKKVRVVKEVYEGKESEKKRMMSQQQGHGDNIETVSGIDKCEDYQNLVVDRQEKYVNEAKRKLQVANVKRERDNSHMDVHERNENGGSSVESFESCDLVEKQKRPKETMENEEKEKQRKETNRKENTKKQKEASCREEIEKKQTQAHEREEKDKGLKVALEHDVGEKSSKVDFEVQDNEKELKLPCGGQQNEMLQEVYKQEEGEKNCKEALQKDLNKQNEVYKGVENEMRQNGSPEREEIDKRLEENGEQEENKKRLQTAYEREGSEKISNMACKEEATDGRSKDSSEWEETRNMIKDACCRDELKGQTKGHEEIESDRERKLSCNEDIHVHLDGEFIEVSEEACKLGYGETQQTTQIAGKHDRIVGQVGTPQEDGKLWAECNGTDKKVEVVEGVDRFVEEGFLSSHTDHKSLQNIVNEMKIKDESIPKSVEADIGNGKANIDSNFRASPLVSDSGRATILAHEHEFKANNFRGLQFAFDQDGSADKFTSFEVVREWISSGRKVGCGVADVQESTGSTRGVTAQGITSQHTERKEKNFSESRGKGKEQRLKSERELEAERLRKIEEEEREREREREKDRMAVDMVTREARDRAFAEARERVGRAAVDRVTAEARSRAIAEARERSLVEKAYSEARLRAERAAVERAAAEARQRAVEKAMAEKAASFRSGGIRQTSSSSDMQDVQYQRVGSSSVLRYSYSSVNDAESESPQRCKARLERHQRTAERAAKALAEKNMRDLLAQREQAERNRLAETLDAEVKRWSGGKEGNLRALLSTLQYILGADCGWQPIPLTEVITSAAVKKAYRKATLCVHPDKLQQRGASIQQKYICEKVFDLLKEAWNKFNSEER